MIFNESMTFDEEEIGRALVSASSDSVRVSDDPAFVEKLRAGDAAAFDTLVDRYSGDVFGLVYRLTENREEAADLTQDTFLKALRSLKGFRGDSGLKTWLYRIAINESRNRFRWWKRRRKHTTISLDAVIGDSEQTVSETLADSSVSPEDSALASEREYALKTALLELGDAYREAVILCDIEGMSYEETAAALGVGVGTVKSRISRGREELRRRLKGY